MEREPLVLCLAKERPVEIRYCLRWLQRYPNDAEAEWMEAARRGEPWALERFYDAYRPLVYRLCSRLIQGTDDTEDATQAVFVSAFRELPRFRGRSSLKTWVYRIALNEALRQRSRRRETARLPPDHPAEGDAAAEVVESVAVRNALEQLTAEHRAILILKFWEGLSGPEIADVLDLSLPAVKMRLHRARKEFRKCYGGPE